MRRTRVLRVSALIVAGALLLVGWRLLASAHMAGAKPEARAPSTLARRLQQLLATHPFLTGTAAALPPGVRVLPVRPGVRPGGVTCDVALGRCSETPCVEFVGAASAPAAPAASVVVFRRETVLQVRPARPLAAPPATCQGRLGTPKVLRVSAPTAGGGS